MKSVSSKRVFQTKKLFGSRSCRILSIFFCQFIEKLQPRGAANHLFSIKSRSGALECAAESQEVCIVVDGGFHFEIQIFIITLPHQRCSQCNFKQ